MTEPQTPHTVIVTQHVTAEHLHEMRGHLPTSLFVSDGDEREDPSGGWRTSMSRMVAATHDVLDVEGAKIMVDFADGTDRRTLRPDEMVEVHIIMPGRTTP